MNEEVRILYVEDFKHLQPNTLQNFEELKKGSLYRAFYTTQEGSVETRSGDLNYSTSYYRLLLEFEDGTYGSIVMPDLKGENDVWVWKIKRVTEDNLADLDLSSEQYKKLASWKKTLHEDIDLMRASSDILKNKETEDSDPLEDSSEDSLDLSSLQRIFDMAQEYLEEDFTPETTMDEIYLNDPMLAAALDKFMNILVSNIRDNKNYDFLDNDSFEYSPYGKGVNAYKAMDSINNYLKQNENHDKNLYEAIKSLLTEIARTL